MLFRQHPESLERLEPWLDRELHVLLGAEEDVELVKEFVLSLMRTCVPWRVPMRMAHALTRTVGGRRYDLQSAAAMRELRPFFFERTEQFVHELVAFARSPFPMGVYDRYVQYGTDEVRARPYSPNAPALSRGRGHRSTRLRLLPPPPTHHHALPRTPLPWQR
jgi:hypothetical protein